LLRRDWTNVTSFDCSIVIFAGRYDYAMPSQVVEKWFQNVRAPAKKFIWFEETAHMIQMERPGLFASYLINDVRPFARQSN
jgi:pimeloyl-ACP methyl ester carboxylesterase